MKELENFDFSIREYTADGGDSVAKRAAEYVNIFDSHADEVDAGLHFILKARFLAKVDAETIRVGISDMGRNYVLTYATDEGPLNALAFISPKKVCVRVCSDFQPVQKTACLLDCSPVLYTIFPSLGSPANETGIRCAKRLFIQMYHEKGAESVPAGL